MVVRIMIKMNGTVQSLDFANQTGFRQLVQIAVNRRQTDVRQILSHLLIYKVGSRMTHIFLQNFEGKLSLFRVIHFVLAKSNNNYCYCLYFILNIVNNNFSDYLYIRK